MGLFEDHKKAELHRMRPWRCRSGRLGCLFRMEKWLKRVSIRTLRPVAFRHPMARVLAISMKCICWVI